MNSGFRSILLFLFLFFILLIDSLFSKSAMDLFKIGILLSILSISYFFYFKWKKIRILKWNTLLHFWVSLFVLVYSYSQGMIHLPDSEIPGQKFYLRFLFYISVFFLFYLLHKREEKKMFWTTIVASLTLPTVWGYLLSGSGYGIIFLYSIYYPFTHRIRVAPSTIALLIFLLVNALGIIFHEYQSYYYYGIFLYLTFFSLILRTQSEKFSTIKYIIQVYLFYLLVSVGIFLNFYFLQGGLADENRSLGSFQVNSVGGSIVFYFPILIYVLSSVLPLSAETTFRKSLKNLWILSIPFVLLLLYLSHTRSAIIASIIFLVYGLYKIIMNMKYRRKILLSIGILMVFMIPFFIEYFLNSKSLITLLIRISIWKTYIETTIQNFPFFGLGFNGQNILLFLPDIQEILNQYELIHKEIASGGTTPHSHNLFVQTILEQGFIGIIVLIVALYLLFTESYFKKTKNKIFTFFPKVVLFSFLVHQFFDYTVQDPNVLFAIAILIGIIQKSSYNLFILHTHRFKKLTLPFLLMLMIPIWILNTNHKQSLVLQENYHISNFQELIEFKPLDHYVYEQSLFLDTLSYGFYLDDRMAMLSGIVNMEYSFISDKNSNEFVEIAKSRLESCKNLNPYNPICKQLILIPTEYRESLKSLIQK